MPGDPTSADPTSAVTTRAQLLADLRGLDLAGREMVIVHSSLSSLGWVPGGEQTVLEVLRTVVGAEATLVMPTQTWQLCDPAYLNDPRFPEPTWDDIRESLPVYDPAVTPTRTMGAVAELFRTLPGTVRSTHPHRSFAAQGPLAGRVVAEHRLEDPMGHSGPLGVLYDCDASVLMLGTTFGHCTALHLAEDHGRPPGRHLVTNGAAVLMDGERRWHSWSEPWPSDDDFDEVGARFVERGGVVVGAVGRARAQVVRMRPLVDFASAWFVAHRDQDTFANDTTARSRDPGPTSAGRPRPCQCG